MKHPSSTLGLSHLLNVGDVFDELHCSDMIATWVHGY